MRAKLLYTILLVLAGSSFCFCQEREADSLKAALVVAQEDTGKVNILLNLSTFYLDSDPDKAKKYGLQALDLAGKTKYRPGRALALKNIGSAYYFLGDIPVTLDYYNQALNEYDSIGDMDGKAKILNNFGTVYYMKGTDDQALAYYIRSMDVAEQIGNKARMATAYSNIANIYHNKPATEDKALTFFMKALVMAEEIDDRNIIGGASVNLGEIYLERNKEDSALYFYDKSLKAYENTINIPYPLREKGQFYAKKKQYPEAIKYLQLSYDKAKQFDSKLDMTQSLLALGEVHFQNHDPASALKAFREAEAIGLAIPAYKELKDIYQGMADVYHMLGQNDKAYAYQKKQSYLSDTLNNQMLSEKLTHLQTNMEIQTRQNQINLLTKDKKLQELDLRSQKIQKTFISLGLALILLIAGIILRNFLESKKVNKVLDSQKAQIETLLLNILPSEVATELQQKGHATPRFYESVSVLFTDFKGFTKHADQMSPQEIVSELNACFMAFDDIVEKYRLEKIKTIGDAYMCAGGIPTPDRSHPVNMVKAGLEMVDHMKWRNEQRAAIGLQPWELRIGIHVGPVAAGVVGKKKYAYDIWGSTVNIASRMESNGEPGQVNISSDTYDLVKDRFDCQHRGKIYAKNIGEIDMYFVAGERAGTRAAQQLEAEI